MAPVVIVPAPTDMDSVGLVTTPAASVNTWISLVAVMGSPIPFSSGENVPTHLMQPDYSQFFPFAFFFTVLHVVTLMIATAPMDTLRSFAMALIYIGGTAVGLVILFRR